MKNQWKQTKLAEVLTPVSRPESVDPTKEYKLLGIRLDGGGPFLRETVTGSQSAATKLFKVETGDFIYSRLFAWRGAFGMIGSDLDGSYVSGEFPTFQPVPDKIDTKFIRFWFRLPSTIERVEADCSGSTPLTRNRFKENFFLDLEITLPPLAEQRRLMARIEALAAKIEEARTLRKETVEQTDAILRSASSQLCRSLQSSCVTIERLVGPEGLQNGKSVKPSAEINGVRCLALSSMRRGHIDVGDSKPVPLTKREAEPFLVRKGDVFVMRGSGSKALCGQAGIVTLHTEAVIFPDLFIRVRLPTAAILPEFFVAVWNSPSTREQLEERAKTTSGIWKVNQGHIASTSIAVPPLVEQRLIVEYLDGLQAKVDTLKKLQAETAAELDALLPSILDKAFKGEL